MQALWEQIAVKLEIHSYFTAQNQTRILSPVSRSESGPPFISLMWVLSYTVEQLQQCIIQLAECNSINFLPPGFIHPDNTHIN